MSGYLPTAAQKHRIYASLEAIQTMADDITVEDDFSPTDFKAMLDNIVSEVVFLSQYVDHNFLSADNEQLTLDGATANNE